MEEKTTNTEEVKENQEKTCSCNDKQPKENACCCHEKHGKHEKHTTQKKLEEQIKKLEEEKKNYLEKLKYSQAELINYRKRKEEQMSTALKYANQDLILEILQVLDNFERAISLDDNNLTDELVKKINDAGSSSFNGSYNNLTDIPTIDGTEIKGTLTKEGLGIASKEDIPTDNSELENGAGYQTASDVEQTISSKKYQTEEQVTQAVTKAVANINKKQVVTSTEEMTDENTIYLMANEGAGNNIYDEYIVYEGTPEKVGTTEVDLSGYIKETDLVEITNEEIDVMMADW